MTPQPVTISQMSDLIARLIQRCTMMNGDIAARSTLFIEADDLRVLKALEVKLFRLADAEDMGRNRGRR